MPYRDLREFISKLEKEGEAIRVEEEVDWNLEAGAIVRRAGERDLPATLFETVKDYPPGYRLFGGTLANFRRIAIAMDMKPDTPPRDLIEEYLHRKKKPIKPILVKDAPCKEHIHIGKEADLLEFPIPMIHAGDGGRYVGTWHVTISRDLDSDWVNWGIYRHMLHDKITVGILLTSKAKHFWSIYSKGYEPKNKPMEVAIAIGVEPISTLCAGNPIPYGVSEVEIVGGVRGEPVELIRCETVDLTVPATAEIVIEGEMRPNETLDEGPFGEYSGYITSPRTRKPIIHVKTITHRNDPIFTMSCLGVPLDDNIIWALTKAATFLDALRQRGLSVRGVYPIPETSTFAVIVAVKAIYSGIASDIAHLIWGVDTSHSSPYVIVVEDDVDPFNLPQVLHALATKCHPQRGIIKLENSPVTPLLPFLDPHEREYRIGANAYFDCTWPQNWNPADVPKRVSFIDSYPAEIQEKALRIWQKYGH
jgi:phenylphosphate carboxylase alpha subunit